MRLCGYAGVRALVFGRGQGEASAVIHFRLLVLWFVLVALGTLHPFVLDWRPVVVPSDSFFVPRLKGLDPAFNVLMFVPLGALLVRLGRRVSSAVVMGLGVSCAIELAQHFIAFRVPVLEDLVFNTAGSFLGAWFAVPLAVLAARFDGRGVRVAFFVLTTSVVLWSAAPPVVTARLWRWAPEATFVVGHEQPGNYEFFGTIHRATLLSAAGRPFWTGVVDATRPAPDLAKRIEADDAFAVEVDFTPSPKRDEVLRRMFTYSAGVQRRNFMVAARGDRLVFRVRTRVTPIVGLFADGEEPLEIDMPRQRSAVRFTFRTGEVTATLDGVEVASKRLMLPPHNGVRTFWLPRGTLGVWLYSFSAGLVVAAGVVGFRTRRTAFISAVVVGLAIQCLQAILFSSAFVPWETIPLLAGAAVGAWTAR